MIYLLELNNKVILHKLAPQVNRCGFTNFFLTTFKFGVFDSEMAFFVGVHFLMPEPNQNNLFIFENGTRSNISGRIVMVY